VQKLLSISDLTTRFTGIHGDTIVVNGLNLSLERGRTVAIVGESGSGKSMTALSIMRLIPPPGFISSGEICFEGRNLVELSENEMRSIRGRSISMIFQEPMTSLNPVLRIGDQVSESFMIHQKTPKLQALELSGDLLHKVGIPSAHDRLRDYPHQLSGGMRQRVMIAMALACSPKLLIADEPTTALDVTIQAQILELIDSLKQSCEMGLLLITHDLGIVAERSDHTCVMYAGRIVEDAPTRKIIDTPRHPYTQALLASLPQNAQPGKPIATISGQATAASANHKGCGFCDRCPVARSDCRNETPPVKEVSEGHFVRCWL
jgi:peptide/nickel transport system ATP-binding protein